VSVLHLAGALASDSMVARKLDDDDTRDWLQYLLQLPAAAANLAQAIFSLDPCTFFITHIHVSTRIHVLRSRCMPAQMCDCHTCHTALHAHIHNYTPGAQLLVSMASSDVLASNADLCSADCAV
jgi:hypothetical protein